MRSPLQSRPGTRPTAPTAPSRSLPLPVCARRSLFSVLVFLLLATTAHAYELRLVREVRPGDDLMSPPEYAGLVLGEPTDPISYSLYLDTEGQSDIILFSVGLTWNPSNVQYEPGLSDLNDYYPLYAPSGGKGEPVTYLLPNTDPPALWPAPPAGLEQLNFEFVAANLNPTVATATNLYLGQVTFSLVGPGATLMDFGFDHQGNIFTVDQIGVQTDIAPLVSTVVVWAPEPSTALLVGVGLGLAGWGRRARRR